MIWMLRNLATVTNMSALVASAIGSEAQEAKFGEERYPVPLLFNLSIRLVSPQLMRNRWIFRWKCEQCLSRESLVPKKSLLYKLSLNFVFTTLQFLKPIHAVFSLTSHIVRVYELMLYKTVKDERIVTTTWWDRDCRLLQVLNSWKLYYAFTCY